jgi:hypothetical protein
MATVAERAAMAGATAAGALAGAVQPGASPART